MDGVALKAERAVRRTDALSRERIIASAVEILDAEGETALTFRSLAGRLSTGAGAIYWHVANKDELLSAATDAIIAPVVSAVGNRNDPQAQIRSIALGLFDAVEAHPWVGSQLARETWRSANTRIFEAVGSRLEALGVPPESQFDVASALANYISGVAVQNAANARSAPPEMDRTTFLAVTAERWAALDPAEYPFVHQVLTQLPGHDDRQQFVAGIDLILAGITKV